MNRPEARTVDESEREPTWIRLRRERATTLEIPPETMSDLVFGAVPREPIVAELETWS